MVTIALTGGIGSGKTTIANRLAELGGVILDADVFAREAVAVGSPALRQIVARFGQQVLLADGTLDRPALGALVFGDDEARGALNDIVHPEVRRLTGERLDEVLADDPAALVVHVIPLLVESTSNYDYEEIWVADAPANVREERLVEGRGMTPEDAQARIASQASDDERRRIADVLIDTSAPLDETLDQVDAEWRRLTAASLRAPETQTYGV
ncbi:dephospho-CoA kinase [Pseudoclavibacter sp. JAI123]|uniref:dephospho-CoA kinase n=1 Tax=Pseudoclavibacter sp. JAI123 TaxID=2723065 RepID=UPI0015CD6AEB|nr:dephospho-CoA kinase [Pseudoclavibacter sp. JAI123]NYF13705.1 dephospho-CoA kinase [Pseudoclavibacter sp. JAI123]